MKLAEALQERAALNTRIHELKERMKANATMQEGVEPAEDPKELLPELERCYTEVEALLIRINMTNSRTLVEGETLTALLARRDCLKHWIRTMQEVCDEASDLGSRYSKSEIRRLSTVDVKALRKRLDQDSARLRKLDNLIQAANWTVELE
jgi:hypothetical protein